MRLPDFVIIGAMKCATSTLHDQLAAQPGFWMSTPKEPYFFSNDEVWNQGLDWYSQLFEDAAAEDLCGESSTHYTKLPTYPQTIARMKAHIPHAKLIYVIRHPIDRLISHYVHDWSERKIQESIDQAIYSHSDLIDYSRYAMQLQPFLEAFGRQQVLLVFFEHLLGQPQQELQRICNFLGYPGTPQWKTSEARNVSSARLRKSPLRDAIVWNPVVTRLRRELVPQSLRDRVKQWWQMKDRPQLSPESLQYLESMFDPDLAQLGSWIDTPLTCKNFKTLASEGLPSNLAQPETGQV